MTVLRLISLPAHGAIELAIGLLMLASPFVLEFGPAGTVSAIVVGALLVGIALQTATDDRSIPVTVHYAADRGVIIGLVGATLMLGIAGDQIAAVFFGAVALAEIFLAVTTRYTRPA